GGRLLRAGVWAATGSLTGATRVAARWGQALGMAMIAFGVVSLLAGGADGLWFAAIGWFLTQAARLSLADVETRQVLRNVTAADVMRTEPHTIPAHTTVESAAQDYFLRYDDTALLVTDDGQMLGMLRLDTVQRVEPD